MAILKLKMIPFAWDELNDLTLDLGLFKKASELLVLRLYKTICLKKYLKYSTFYQEKVHFYNTFKVTGDLCIFIRYMV